MHFSIQSKEEMDAKCIITLKKYSFFPSENEKKKPLQTPYMVSLCGYVVATNWVNEVLDEHSSLISATHAFQEAVSAFRGN